MTDEIERVRALCNDALREVHASSYAHTFDERVIAALAKRLQPKPTPPAPKVWSVSEGTAKACGQVYRDALFIPHDGRVYGDNLKAWLTALNAIVDDILRDRPDAVAKEWERRMREAIVRGDHVISERDLASVRRDLFPEVEG